MTIHQPGYAHFAVGMLPFAVALFAVGRFTRPYFARRRGPVSEAEARGAKRRERRNSFAAAAGFAQLILDPLSRAYDLPHHASTRTWIIALGCPLLLLLSAYIRPKGAQREDHDQESRPYYAAAPAEPPRKRLGPTSAIPASQWRGPAPPSEVDSERAEL